VIEESRGEKYKFPIDVEDDGSACTLVITVEYRLGMSEESRAGWRFG